MKEEMEAGVLKWLVQDDYAYPRHMIARIVIAGLDFGCSDSAGPVVGRALLYSVANAIAEAEHVRLLFIF